MLISDGNNTILDAVKSPLPSISEGELVVGINQILDVIEKTDLEFTAWGITTALVQLIGDKYFIPHSEKPGCRGVRILVREIINDRNNSIHHRMYVIQNKISPDGNFANYYVPVSPPVADTSTAIQDGDNPRLGELKVVDATSIQKVDKFTFED